MEIARFIVLIDDDVRRRAASHRFFAGIGSHVEPYEAVDEIRGKWPSHALVLVHDSVGAVEAAIDDMTRRGLWLPTVAYNEVVEISQVVEAMVAGALDYMVWPFRRSAAAAMFENVRARVDRLGVRKLRAAQACVRIEHLTRREREVLGGVASGYSNRAIGERLQLSPRTIEVHRASMLSKLGAAHSSDAVRIAIEAADANEALLWPPEQFGNTP